LKEFPKENLFSKSIKSIKQPIHAFLQLLHSWSRYLKQSNGQHLSKGCWGFFLKGM